MDHELETQSAKTPKFTLAGYEVRAKVVRVVDGDTVHVVFKFADGYYKFNCRVIRIDTPEMRKHGELAKMAKRMVSDLLLGKLCTVNCHKFDNFGRLLVDIKMDDGVDLADYLVEKKLAKYYDGKHKSTFEDLFEYHGLPNMS